MPHAAPLVLHRATVLPEWVDYNGHMNEAHRGDRLTIATQLLGHDKKRLHLHHAMRREGDAGLLATTELMLLHVDMSGPRAAPFDAAAAAIVQAIAADHAGLGRPERVGRVISLR